METQPQSLRPEILSPDVLDALAYALHHGPFNSAHVHRDATLEDLTQGNGRVLSSFAEPDPDQHLHYHDPDWAIVHYQDAPGDQGRGYKLLTQAGYQVSVVRTKNYHQSPPTPREPEPEPLLCPACDGSGGFDEDGGAVSCDLCYHSGQVRPETAQAFIQDQAGRDT